LGDVGIGNVAESAQPQEPPEQQLLEPQHEVEVQLLEPLVAPVSGTATASRTLMTSMLSKSSSGRSMSGAVEWGIGASSLVRFCLTPRAKRK
jgi:hypothetical protein